MTKANVVRHIAESRPSETSGAAGTPAERHDASALQSLLNRAFTEQEAQPTPAPLQKAPAEKKPAGSRWLKTVAGIAIVALVGWMPMQRLFQVSSVEAVINAPVVTVRAPIEGAVDNAFGALKVGETIAPGAPLVTVTNARADARGVLEAEDAVGRLRAERSAISARIYDLEQNRAVVASRVEGYRQDRIRRVEAQLREADARIASAEAVRDRAVATEKRLADLSTKGVGSMVATDDASSAVAVAEAAVREAEARRATLAVEAEALAAGRFLGDDYNDEPRSAQRLDEIDESVSALKAEGFRLDAQLLTAVANAERAQASLQLAETASMPAPVSGRIWEILTAPGEQVAAGQHLVSVLDCSKLVVTAAVSEAVYNTLSVGQSATFTFREGGRALAGHVSQLSGMASAPSTFAILPSSLTKEAYRVAVTVDGSQLQNCPVGRTGRVVFGEASK